MSKRILDAPCKGCVDRRLGCHGVCKDYVEYSTQRRAMIEDKYELKKTQSALDSIRIKRQQQHTAL